MIYSCLIGVQNYLKNLGKRLVRPTQSLKRKLFVKRVVKSFMYGFLVLKKVFLNTVRPSVTVSSFKIKSPGIKELLVKKISDLQQVNGMECSVRRVRDGRVVSLRNRGIFLSGNHLIPTTSEVMCENIGLSLKGNWVVISKKMR